MAYVITVALLKGGVSKTTTAIALGEAAALSVPAVIVDTDPMGSLIRWRDLAAADGHPLRAEVIGHAGPNLGRRLVSAARNVQVVVIDTPPPGALDRSREAIAAADLVVMPVPPNLADLDRVLPTVEMAEGKNIGAVLTQVRGGIEERAVAAHTLKAWGVHVYATELPLTVAVQRAYGQPLTSGPLLRFGIDLMTEILKEI